MPDRENAAGPAVRARRYVVLANHGGFYCHGSRIYGPEGYTTIGRTFRCECGEPLRDGIDNIDGALYDEGRYVHINCRATVRPTNR